MLLEELPGEVDAGGAHMDKAEVCNEGKLALGPRGGAFPDMSRRAIACRRRC